MQMPSNIIQWFEIPVLDMVRARHFYQVVFGIHMHEAEVMGMQMAYFPGAYGDNAVQGALVKSAMHKPSEEGVLVYLNASPDMQSILDKIEAEGGKILMGKMQLSPELGYTAFFTDTEGNKIALHSWE